MTRTSNTPECVRQIIEMGQQLLAEHGLTEQGWTVKMVDEDDDFTVARCLDGPRIITLDRYHMLNTDFRNIREAFLHEIAHALVSDGWHDQPWYDKLMEMGGSGVWIEDNGTTISVVVRPRPDLALASHG